MNRLVSENGTAISMAEHVSDLTNRQSGSRPCNQLDTNEKCHSLKTNDAAADVWCAGRVRHSQWTDRVRGKGGPVTEQQKGVVHHTVNFLGLGDV